MCKITPWLLSLLFLVGQGWMMPGWALAPAPAYEQGVQLYRSGRYQAAGQYFAQLSRQHPDDARLVYYQAICQAHLKRFSEAKPLYQQVLLLDPRGPVGAMARKGLAYLPASKTSPVGLDRPPQPVVSATSSPSWEPEPSDQPMNGGTVDAYGNRRSTGSSASAASTHEESPALRPLSPPSSSQKNKAIATSTPPSQSSSVTSDPAEAGVNNNGMPGGMTPQAMQQQMQTMMMMQMMSGLGGGNANNGMGMFNPMMMMQGQPGSPPMDPAVMKEWLMGQMMNGMDLGGSSGDNKN